MGGVKSDDIGACEGTHRFRRRIPSIRMRDVHCRPEGFAGNGVRTRQGLFQSRDGTCLFAVEDRCGKLRLTQDGTQHLQRRAALVSHRQRSQRDRGPIHIHAARQQRPDVGHSAGDLRLVHAGNTQIEDTAGQGSHASLALAVVCRTRREIDLDIHNRKTMVLDEKDTRARSRLPALDLRAGVTQLRDKRQTQADQQHARIHEDPLSDGERMANARAALSARAADRVRPRSTARRENTSWPPPGSARR